MIKQIFTILLFSSLNHTVVCSIDKLELESAIKHLKVKEASKIINKIELSADEIEHLKDLAIETYGKNTGLILSNLSGLRDASGFFAICSSPLATLYYLGTRKWAFCMPSKSWFEAIPFKEAPDLRILNTILSGIFISFVTIHAINAPFYYYYNNKDNKVSNILTQLKNKKSK